MGRILAEPEVRLGTDRAGPRPALRPPTRPGLRGPNGLVVLRGPNGLVVRIGGRSAGGSAPRTPTGFASSAGLAALGDG